MSKAVDTSRHQGSVSGFIVMAPRRSDMLSRALHRVYDDRRTVPDDFALLLEQLDRVDYVRQ